MINLNYLICQIFATTRHSLDYWIFTYQLLITSLNCRCFEDNFIDLGQLCCFYHLFFCCISSSFTKPFHLCYWTRLYLNLSLFMSSLFDLMIIYFFWKFTLNQKFYFHLFIYERSAFEVTAALISYQSGILPSLFTNYECFIKESNIHLFSFKNLLLTYEFFLSLLCFILTNLFLFTFLMNFFLSIFFLIHQLLIFLIKFFLLTI